MDKIEKIVVAINPEIILTSKVNLEILNLAENLVVLL
jgi:hypothetical protein